jgi:predicted small lipoprotein YifL
MTRAIAIHAALAALASLALAGCGKQGELESPRAIAGRPAPAPTGWVADRQTAAARARADADAVATAGPEAPQSVQEVRAVGSLPAPRDPPLVPPDGPAASTPAP